MTSRNGADTATRENRFSMIQRRILEVVHIGEREVELLLVAMLARGHALIEGIPGVGKTLLARTIARCVSGSFHRVQFTNDVMPADVVGSLVWRPREENFEFVEGPLFANLVLADEINRSSPRTLSCLLEAMENGYVSVEGNRRQLADPFTVLATRNPIEFHGTFPIPEAALDRFLLRIELGYPEAAAERALYLGENPEHRLDRLEPVISLDELRAGIRASEGVEVREAIAEYVLRFCQASRQHDGVALGASPRAGLAWLRAARAQALLRGRKYVLPDDLRELALPVLGHRIFADGGAGQDGQSVVAELLETVPVEL